MSAMTEQDRQKLADLHAKFDAFFEDWKDVKSGQGFARCATRGEEIKSLKTEVSWIRNTFITVVLMAVLTIGINKIWGQDEIQHTAAASERGYSADGQPDGAGPSH